MTGLHNEPAPPDLPYRIPWRSVGYRAGAHRATVSGTGGLFCDFTSLLRHPDPRRIDLSATVRDPFDMVHVRRFEQTSAIAVYALIDVSASMAFKSARSKLDIAAELVRGLAASVHRTGDAFGMIGCDTQIRRELLFPAVRSRRTDDEMVKRLRDFRPTGSGARGLSHAAGLLSGRRKLVFVVSDFLAPEDELAELFGSLGQHDIFPVVVEFKNELDAIPTWGILNLSDLETGRRRLVVMRPTLRQKWINRRRERRAALFALAGRFGRKPFEIFDRIDWHRLVLHIIEGGG